MLSFITSIYFGVEMLFGNDDNSRRNYDGDQNENGSLQAASGDTDLDYLYGPAPERPLFTSLARERGQSAEAPLNQGSVQENRAEEHEAYVETLSGFLLVVKGTGDKAVLSVRRKVGTPPNNSVVLNTDELRRLTNVLSEMMPAPASRELLTVGAARSLSDGEIGLESFIEREYPELARRRKKPENAGNKKKIIVAACASVIGLAATLLIGLISKSTPFAGKISGSGAAAEVSDAQDVQQRQAKVENLARSFVTDMLDFKTDTYRQSQVRALSMMSEDLSGRYWQETHFPLTRQQLRKMPAQNLTIESVKSVVLAAGNYAVDVQGQLTTKSGVIPILIRLSIQADGDKYTVTDQKDLSATLGATSATSAASAASASGSNEQAKPND